MSKSNAAFVFVHGAWHNHATWDRVVPSLNALGFATETLDLPGAGVNARAPASFRRRPFDAAAFASEPSPNAGVTQEERTDAVIAAVEKAADAGNSKVVLVGHSLGGLTITDVAERIPTKLDALGDLRRLRKVRRSTPMTAGIRSQSSQRVALRIERPLHRNMRVGLKFGFPNDDVALTLVHVHHGDQWGRLPELDIE